MCDYRFYSVNRFIHSFSNSITSRTICRRLGFFGARAVSYPIHFVTGAIGNIFNKDGSKQDKNKIKQLEAENQKLETENKKI